MMFNVTASSFRGGESLWLIDAQGYFLAILFYSSLLPHSLQRFLFLGKGGDRDVVDYNDLSFTDLFPAMIHDLVDVRGGQPGLV